jgi:hypothetical protein
LRRTVSNEDAEDNYDEDEEYSNGGGGGFMGRGTRGGGNRGGGNRDDDGNRDGGNILSRVGSGEVSSIEITNLNYEINEADLTELFETVRYIRSSYAHHYMLIRLGQSKK